MAYSQNGFLAMKGSLIATYTIPSSNVKVSLRKGDVSVVLLYLCEQFNLHVQQLRQNDTGGYNPRSIIGAGSRDISNHASGTAVDLRWNAHPLGAHGTFSAAQVKAIRTILSFLEGAVRWGGDYRGRKDEMHFEINASMAVVSRIATKIRNARKGIKAVPGGKKATPAKPTNPKNQPMILKVGVANNVEVRNMQRKANTIFPAYAATPLTVDGDFGPRTESFVKEFQRRTGLKQDGIVGPNTRAMLKRYHVL